MTEWKAAGRAQREAEDDLWNRFRGAQDVFFAARAEVFAERDSEQRDNLAAQGGAGRRGREAAPGDGPEGGPRRVPLDQRALGGHRPRPARRPPQDRGPDARRRARPAGRPRSRSGAAPTPRSRARAAGLAGQLQAAVDKLRDQIDAARAAGNTAKADKLAAELEGRQALLDQALKGMQEFGG